MNLSLLNDFIILPVMDDKTTLISSDVHRLVQRSPRCLGNNVILRPSNFFISICIFAKCALKVIDSHIRFLVMIIDNQELLVSQIEFNMFCLNIRHRNGCLYYHLPIKSVENAKSEGSSRRQYIL